MTHWTDNHIMRDGEEYVGYDEAGLELTRHKNRELVRDRLVLYSYLELSLTRFPVELRKMWHGRDVKNWIDRNIANQWEIPE